MKAIIFYIALLFWIESCVYGQCLQNGGFLNACAGQVWSGPGGDCGTWTDACGDGWVRSHGTPNFGTYTVIDKGGQTITRYYAYMWSNNNGRGEGMYTNYLFQRGNSYKVTLTVSTTNENGSIKVYAASGLTQGGLSKQYCGDYVPTSNVYKVLIGEYTGKTNGDITLSFVFPDNDLFPLTQIWVYPEGTGDNNYELFLKELSICPSCEGTVNLTTGHLSRGTSQAGTINVGNTSGTVPVTNIPNAETDLIASNEIHLLPEFAVILSDGGSFSAKIQPCSGASAARMDVAHSQPPVALSKDMRPIADDGDVKEMQKLTVYPSITTGIVNITGNPQDLENVELIVYDQLGRKMMQLPKATYSSKAAINLGTLNNGVYILQVKQLSKTITQKIIVQK